MSANCREHILEVVEEGTGKFGKSYELNESKMSRIDDICDCVEGLIEEFDCEYFDVDIDEITKRLTISLACDSMVFRDGRSHDFFKMIALLDSFAFSKGEDGLTVLSMNLNDMWRYMNGR